MAAIKPVLRNKKRKDETYPLAIRINKGDSCSYIYLGHNVLMKDWDEENRRVRKSHPNSTRLNNFIMKKVAEVNDKYLELETNKHNISSHSIKRQVKQNHAGITFFRLAETFIENLKRSGKFTRVSSDQPRIKQFREFLKGEDIAFQDITPLLVQKFRAYLKGTRHVSERSVVNTLIVIRTLYNQAIKNELVDRKHYPFGKDKVRIKFPESIRIGLTPEEVKKIEELQLPPNTPLNDARNVWLFSFYFAGMRVSDVLRLKWSDFQSDRLHYSMGKNTKTGSLKIPEKAAKILAQYAHQKRTETDVVFPYLKMVDNFSDTYAVQKKIANAIHRIDDWLAKVAEQAKVGKKLTMHIARHTFGNISGERIPIQMLQKLYRHSSITTTIAYQANFIHKDADAALDAVVTF